MKLSKTLLCIEAAMMENVPIMLWGKPGIGKSSIVEQLATKFGVELRDIRLSQMESVDLKGIPSIKDGRTIHSIPIELPTDPDSKGIIFLDEINKGSKATQAAAYQLVCDRRLGEYVVPKGWRIIAAGNLEDDGAFVNKIGTALANRFVHFYVDPDVKEWSSWMLGEGMPHQLIAFINSRPEFIHKMDLITKEHAFASPRSLFYLGKIMKKNMGSPIFPELATSAIGEGAASELINYLDNHQHLPSLDDLIKDPTNAIYRFTDINEVYALILMVVAGMDATNVSQLMKWVITNQADFQTMAVKMINDNNHDLMATPELTKWIISNPEVFKD